MLIIHQIFNLEPKKYANSIDYCIENRFSDFDIPLIFNQEYGKNL